MQTSSAASISVFERVPARDVAAMKKAVSNLPVIALIDATMLINYKGVGPTIFCAIYVHFSIHCAKYHKMIIVLPFAVDDVSCESVWLQA